MIPLLLLLPHIIAPSSPSTPFKPLTIVIVVVSTAMRSPAVFAVILADVAAISTTPNRSAAGVVSLVAARTP